MVARSTLRLPAGLAGLAGVALIVVASAAASAATEALSTTLGAVGFGLGFVDLQSAPAEFGSVQRCNRFVCFAGIGHFYKGETASAASFTIGHDADFFDCPVRFEDTSQLRLGCAVG